MFKKIVFMCGVVSIAGLSSILLAPSRAAVMVSDAELDGIVVGGPVTQCADCSCPQCYDTACSEYYDPVGGWMCKDVDGHLFSENCACDGWGFSSPYCHVLTWEACWTPRTFHKTPEFPCLHVDPILGIPTLCTGHALNSSGPDQNAYQECTETDSDPHL